MFVERAKCVCMLVNNIYCMFSSFLLKEQSVGSCLSREYSVCSCLSREVQCIFALVKRNTVYVYACGENTASVQAG